MTYRQEHISQKSADKVLNMSQEEIKSNIIVEDGRKYCSNIDGVEIEIDWYNPDCAIICHYWIDPKLRGENIGTITCKKIVNELRKINRLEFVTTAIQSPNKGTIKLLQKCGFEDIKNYDKEPFDSQIVEGYMNL